VLAQVIVNPTVTPEINDGGWVYNSAVLLAVIGVLVTLLVVFGYMRFAPRFQTDEGAGRRVRAPRVQPGKDVRRPVNVTSAPIVAQPPVLAAPVGGAGATAPGSGSAAGSPPSVAQAPAAASQSPSASTPAPAVVAEPAPAPAATAPEASAGAAEPVAPAAEPAPAPTAHAEVSLDQETFDRTLAELLEKGTDRRVAEGQARRAAMIAARKKAGG
jgi:hypothetical protein